VLEELNCRIKPASVRHLGGFAAPAANEVGERVLLDLYVVELEGVVTPAAEIEESAWLDAAAPGAYRLAPLTADCVLPLLLSM
jgi:8-oxo-dGTP diphosphatase